ncbi:MAG: putative Ig domain-containing protein [Verrucomicrobiota bacterium]|nr:putative Ig domain-containing protein [Verrucomicrobiota bacterium]
MISIRTLLWTGVAALLCASSAHAAVTDYVDDFSGTLKYANSTGFNLSIENGALTMQVGTAERWKGQYMALGETKDFSANPYMSMKIRTMDPNLLTGYFFSTGGGNWTKNVRIHPSENFVEYFFDFSGVPAADRAKINGIQLTPNGNSSAFRGTLYIDDIKIGTAANKAANMGALRNQIVPADAKAQKILVLDLVNATGLTVTGAENLIENIQISALSNYSVGADAYKIATITYDCKAGATGTANLTITATGAAGFANKSQTISITVEADNPPALGTIADLQVPVGVLQKVQLTGLDDGDISRNQALTITATSSVPTVIATPLPAITRSPGSPYGTLSFTAANPGTTTVTATVSDGAAAGHQVSKTFQVQAFATWNAKPTLDEIEAQEVFIGQGDTQIPLTGISDGDSGTQTLSITATAANPAIISGVSVNYVSGATGTLTITPNAAGTGETTITVTVTDNGTAAGNNGNQSIVRTFKVVTRVVLPDEVVADLTQNQAAWVANSSMSLSFIKDGADNVVKSTFNSKSTWDGLDYNHPDIDMTDYAIVTFDIKAEKAGVVTVFVWDNAVLTPEEELAQGAHYNTGHTIQKNVAANTWTTLTFDFRSPAAAMTNSKGTALNKSWITHTLINYHSPALSWPFTSVSGSYSIKNFRLGKAALPATTPNCVIDAIGDRWHFRNPGVQALKVTGIGSGSLAASSVAVTSTNAALFSNLSISAVGADKGATLTYTLNDIVGEATVSVTVSAAGSNNTTKTFLVKSLEKNPASALTVSLDQATTYQKIYGFGTFSDRLSLVDEYTGLLGASAMRVGMIGNQIESENDNNDPYVLNRAALNYNVFDWAYYRALKAKGVETFILTSWSPPAWMKDNLSGGYGFASAEGNTDNTDNRLAYHFYEEYAESMVAVYRMFQEECGINLKGIGLQNEPTFHEPYESAILDTARFVQLIKIVGKRFADEGIVCELYMPEQVFSQTSSMNAYIDALNADATARQYGKVIATHGYAADGVGGGQPNFSAWSDMYTRSQINSPKELWMTETYPEYNTWADGLNYAAFLYGSLEYGRINLWTSWGYDGQFRTNGLPNMALYTASQFYRYIRPGATRIRSTAPADILVTSYKNDAAHGSKLVSVITNLKNTSAIIKLSGANMPASFSVTRTDEKSKHVSTGTLLSTDVLILPPQSVTSLVSLEGAVENQAPVISVNLAASPATVTGNQTTLSLTATDGNGDPLTVTWSSTSAPAGSTPTGTGDSNATSGVGASKVITFPGTGTYKFNALVTDGIATVVSNEVTVTVTSTASTIAVSPATATVWPNFTGVFEAIIKDQFGTPMTGQTVNWTLTGPGSLVNNSGATMTYAAPASTGSASVTATSGTLSASATITLSNPPNPPVVTTASLPNGRVNKAYSAGVGTTGGEGLPTWSVLSGTLPPGLSLTGQGRFTGTPTTEGSFTFVLRATDSRNVTGTKEFTIVIDPPPVVPVWDISTLPSGATAGWINTFAGEVYYDKAVYPWAWHNEHGWLFTVSATNQTSDAFWAFSPNSSDWGWLWIADATYPWLFGSSLGHWVWYMEDTKAPRQFWDPTLPAPGMIELNP